MTVYLHNLEDVKKSIKQRTERSELQQSAVKYFTERLEPARNKKIDRRVFDNFRGYKLLNYEKDEYNRVSLYISDVDRGTYKFKELHMETVLDRCYETDWAYTIVLDEDYTVWGDVLDAWQDITERLHADSKEDIDEELIEDDYREIVDKTNELNKLLDTFYNDYKINLERK